MRPAFDGLILRPNLLDDLGPAICDGQAVFLHGPPGNGKTLIARRIGRFLNRNGGEIYVPYAVQVDSAIVTVFDPNIHQTTDDAAAADGLLTARQDASLQQRPLTMHEAGHDLRWRRIRRPVVITAGELTLGMLDLRYHSDSGYYAAPSHLKANGGVFVIDDFGRQQVSPQELLNRWILPLAERIDYLTLATGKKFAVPFEQLVIFSTNLDPQELVDDAFLRRIRHKLAVSPPTREQFSGLFESAWRGTWTGVRPRLHRVSLLQPLQLDHPSPPGGAIRKIYWRSSPASVDFEERRPGSHESCSQRLRGDSSATRLQQPVDRCSVSGRRVSYFRNRVCRRSAGSAAHMTASTCIRCSLFSLHLGLCGCVTVEDAPLAARTEPPQPSVLDRVLRRTPPPTDTDPAIDEVSGEPQDPGTPQASPTQN